MLDLIQHPAHGAALPDDAGQPRALALFTAQVYVFDLQSISESLHLARGGLHRLVALLPCQHLTEHAADHCEPVAHLGRPRSFCPDGAETERPHDAPIDRQGNRERGFRLDRLVAGSIGGRRNVGDCGKSRHFPGQNPFARPWKYRSSGKLCIEGRYSFRRPANRIGETSILIDLVEGASIDTELLADTAQPRFDRLVNLIVGKIDELKRQLRDEAFEGELLLERCAMGVFEAVSLVDVEDRCENEQTVCRPERSQSDLGGEQRSVFAADQLATGCHLVVRWRVAKR